MVVTVSAVRELYAGVRWTAPRSKLTRGTVGNQEHCDELGLVGTYGGRRQSREGRNDFTRTDVITDRHRFV